MHVCVEKLILWLYVVKENLAMVSQLRVLLFQSLYFSFQMLDNFLQEGLLGSVLVRGALHSCVVVSLLTAERVVHRKLRTDDDRVYFQVTALLTGRTRMGSEIHTVVFLSTEP